MVFREDSTTTYSTTANTNTIYIDTDNATTSSNVTSWTPDMERQQRRHYVYCLPKMEITPRFGHLWM